MTAKVLTAKRSRRPLCQKDMITAEQLQTMSESDKLALIFMPGVSTAEKLSERVRPGRRNGRRKDQPRQARRKSRDRFGPGKGSAFRIKLPLTLAIIPSLLVSDSGERFAIPQVSVGELIRIPANQIAERIDRAGDAEAGAAARPAGPAGLPCRSSRQASRQSARRERSTSFWWTPAPSNTGLWWRASRHGRNCRQTNGKAPAGPARVCGSHDSGRRAGGRDPRRRRSGRARRSVPPRSIRLPRRLPPKIATGEMHSLLLFRNAPGEHCAVPIELVTRVERVSPEQVEYLGGRRTMQYGGVSLPLVTLHDVAAVGELAESQQWVVVVFDCAGRPIGLLVAEPLDMIETRLCDGHGDTAPTGRGGFGPAERPHHPDAGHFRTGAKLFAGDAPEPEASQPAVSTRPPKPELSWLPRIRISSAARSNA